MNAVLDALRTILQSPHVVDGVLAVLLVEIAVLLMWARRGRGPALVDVGAQIAAGACLLLALRTALSGADPIWIGAWLLAAFPANVWDMARRFRRR